MIPNEYLNESDIIKQLFTLGSPHERKAVITEQWDDHLAQGITLSDIPVLAKIVLDTESVFSQSQSKEGWACVYAWRALGQLKSAEAIEPLMVIMDLAHDNDWVLEELPTVMGMIGEPAIEPLARYLMDDSPKEFSRAAASDGLANIVKSNHELRDAVVSKFGEYLKSPDHRQESLNGLIVCNLIDLQATELIDLIRPLYEQEWVDISVSGDWEDVEIGFGLRSKRETPKPHYGLLNRHAKFNEPLHMPNTHTFIRDTPKVGRNDPCPCGSGKKYKKCCLN